MATKKKAQKAKAVAKRKPAPTKQKSAARSARAARPQSSNPLLRRPAQNEPIGMEFIDEINETLAELKTEMENFAAHLRSLDRRRMNGMGIERQGFAIRSYELATENPEFLPHWLTIPKFKDDLDVFFGIRKAFDLNRQVQELAWNLVMLSADMAYTDALEFYDSVQSAAERRIDAAESVYAEMMKFFSRGGTYSKTGKLTKKALKKDAIGIIDGKKDGKIVLEHESPKLIEGKTKAIDKTFKSKASFEDSESGEIES